MRRASDGVARRAALALLRRGQATPTELGELAGVSRQTVESWAAHAGVDWRAIRSRIEAKRRERQARAWRKAISDEAD